MNLFVYTCLLLVIGSNAFAQTDYEKNLIEYQASLDEEYENPDESPLEGKALRKFKGHRFFPIDEKYKVTARFIKSDNPAFFQMKTTTRRIADYDIYGIAQFDLNGKSFTLNIYQSHRLRKMEQYKDDLFLPFIDLTNGEETYAAGRYIDLSIPEGNEIIIDFNKAYNPYCVYSYKYSCPIPPLENSMDTRVEAGIMAPKKKR
ncbi:MAG: DUF1684 domain-containing protein [Cyclobacteriaceae bacterium]